MGIFGKLFGSGNNEEKEMAKLEHAIQIVPKTTVNCKQLGVEAFVEAQGRGYYKDVQKDVAKEIFIDFEKNIEGILQYKIAEKLAELGKTAEFEKVKAKGWDLDAYYSYAIPAYGSFLSKASREAKLQATTGR